MSAKWAIRGTILAGGMFVQSSVLRRMRYIRFLCRGRMFALPCMLTENACQVSLQEDIELEVVKLGVMRGNNLCTS
jgi:hypothetical protein